MAKQKIYTITSTSWRNGRTHDITGTLAELIQAHRYTLECGASWQHEKGNKKINTAPKTIKSLVTNLNNAVNNSAANGCSDKHYSWEEVYDVDPA